MGGWRWWGIKQFVADYRKESTEDELFVAVTREPFPNLRTTRTVGNIG